MKPLNTPSSNSNHATHTNGKAETLLHTSGVSSPRPPVRHKPTVFASDPPLRGLEPVLYGLTRFELMGFPAIRTFTALWLIIAAIALFNLVPFAQGWLVAAVAMLMIQIVLVRRWQNRQFVRFQPQPSPLPEPDPLPASEKLPVFVTALFHVEGKYQRFTALPGFYRTFATGEHALLCQVRNRTWFGVFRWPADEIGMWYVFVAPTDVTHLEWGELSFGATTLPCLAVIYSLELPPDPRQKQPKRIEETVYIAAAPEQARRIYADLLHQLPATAIAAPKALAN